VPPYVALIILLALLGLIGWSRGGLGQDSEHGQAQSTQKDGGGLHPGSGGGGVIGSTAGRWVGYAASPNRRAFQSGVFSTEMAARNAARNECKMITQHTCNVIAVPESADVSAVGCRYRGRSQSFVGGSDRGNQKRIALDKANQQGFPDPSCVEFYKW
jgi:hypothetical protein